MHVNLSTWNVTLNRFPFVIVFVFLVFFPTGVFVIRSCNNRENLVARICFVVCVYFGFFVCVCFGTFHPQFLLCCCYCCCFFLLCLNLIIILWCVCLYETMTNTSNNWPIKHGLRIGYLNINNAVNKKEDIATILHNNGNPFHVFCFSESRLNPNITD